QGPGRFDGRIKSLRAIEGARRKNLSNDTQSTNRSHRNETRLLGFASPGALLRRRTDARQSQKQNYGQALQRAYGTRDARISQDLARAELRGDQTRLSGHCRRRRFRDSGSQRHTRSVQEQEGTQEIPALRQALWL